MHNWTQRNKHKYTYIHFHNTFYLDVQERDWDTTPSESGIHLLDVEGWKFEKIFRITKRTLVNCSHETIDSFFHGVNKWTWVMQTVSHMRTEGVVLTFQICAWNVVALELWGNLICWHQPFSSCLAYILRYPSPLLRPGKKNYLSFLVSNLPKSFLLTTPFWSSSTFDIWQMHPTLIGYCISISVLNMCVESVVEVYM